MAPQNPNTVCYDGECKFCQASVNWLKKRDVHGRMLFKPMEDAGDSVILHDAKGTWLESTAVLRALASLGGPWKLARTLLIIPAPLRNAAYRWVAKRRHRFTAAPEEAQNTA